MQCNIKAMSKNERLKIELDYLKSVFVSVLAGILGVASYGFVNYATMSLGKFLVLCGALFFLVVCFALLAIRVGKKLNELEKLKDRQ